MMATNAGIILGTAAYMSPEQAKGFAADHRSDVFSFGVVLYEMLTGRQPFQGETAPDVLASVLIREPELQRLPTDLNPRIAELLRRCLEKNPKRRWQAIGDLRAEIEALMSSPRAVPSHSTIAAPPKPLWRRVLPISAAAILAAVLSATAVWQLKPSPRSEIVRFPISLPDSEALSGVGGRAVDISPDGRHVVFSAGGMIHVRPLSGLDATPLSGTQGQRNATSPTFSPDGQHVAFFTGEGSLKRVPIGGGVATIVSPVSVPANSMTWAGNEIFFVSADGFMRVPAEGGTPVRVDIGSDERVQRVQLLPDGNTLLLTILPPGESVERWSNAQIVARSLESGARKQLVKGASDGWYVATGHLLYMIEGRLHAVSFDPSRLEISGPAVEMVEGVRRASLNQSGLGMFSVSSTGALVYMPGPASLASSQSDVGIVERNGTLTPLKLPPAPYRYPRVSPDGERIVVETDDGKDAVVRVYDLLRGGALQRITFAGKNRFPVWTADSRRVTFQSDRDGDHGIFWQAADGSSSNAERLTTAAAGERHIPESWHPRRRGAALQRRQGCRVHAVELFGPGQTGDSIRRGAFADADRRHLRTGWEMGCLYAWTVHDRDHLRAAVPGHRCTGPTASDQWRRAASPGVDLGQDVDRKPARRQPRRCRRHDRSFVLFWRLGEQPPKIPDRPTERAPKLRRDA